MQDVSALMTAFVSYVRTLKGDEKGEAQVFCDRLFRAFGHEGYKEAGATLEERVKLADGRTKFADLRWGKRVLIEMKKRGERLGSPRVYNQVYEYWQRLVPNKPQYVVLCNFDDLWIYEFDEQLDEPMDRIKLTDLPSRWPALNFLLLQPKKPLFENNRKEVSDATASKLGEVFRAMVARGETPERAQRFTLQCIVAMFAEDTDLLPRGLFTELVNDCLHGQSSYDLLGGLFRQMNTDRPARGGRYKNVRYFNGGLFGTIDPIDLTPHELSLLARATDENWSRIHPGIFGTLFQATMDEDERHERGAHYTPEVAIFEHVVRPSLIQPWRSRIREASTLKELLALRDGLTKVRVLDPACGSGNFLYVAYRELKRLELELLEKVHERFSAKTRLEVGAKASIQSRQFFGIDTDRFAVELAKVTLMLGKKLALDEAHHALEMAQVELGLDIDQPLPLENLDDNVRCDDALFCAWPKADVIIGNPPFQSKNKMQQELGAHYVQRVRSRYPDVPGRADYCVYWFRRAHDELAPGACAGLVGTNTIRQNYSREGGLDHIVANGGTITEAVSTMVWPGEAVVHVSVVNWTKGLVEGPKKLSWQEGDDHDSPWKEVLLDRIPASLSPLVDVTGAKVLRANAESGTCYQGQTHGHEGFLLSPDEARAFRADKTLRKVIHPYLTGDDLVGRYGSEPSRWVIDLNHCETIIDARQYRAVFERLKRVVLPDIEAAAASEREETGRAKGPRQAHAQRWWRHWRGRGEMLAKLEGITRWIACSRVTKRPIFEFVSSRIHPNDALMVFPFEDDYSFGILQSGIHWEWFKARCSTLKGDWRYTSNTVYDSFPWPQSPSEKQCAAVASAGVALRALRREIAAKHEMSLRAMYASMEDLGKHPLKEAHSVLDAAVRAAYGIGPRKSTLVYLLELNRDCAMKEAKGHAIMAPGLPAGISPKKFVNQDAIEAPRL
ncbi:MAG: class I SAM-dependent DNA methyltransferase [Polyangiaceae bacterium]|nr:class I SAM-dependent DNA methyltransferase [Polyangiaceae bacterium]